MCGGGGLLKKWKSGRQAGAGEGWEPGPPGSGRLGAPAHGGEAHHGRQCDALVPLRIGRLLQDLAAELEDNEDR